MRPLIKTLLMVMLFANSVICTPVFADKPKALPRSLQLDVGRKLVPAIHKNDMVAVVHTLAVLVNRAGESRMSQLDSLLKSKGMPDSGALLLEAHMALADQQAVNMRSKSKQKQKKSRPGATETRLLFQTLHGRLTELDAASVGNLTVADFAKTGSSFDEYATFLRDVYRTGKAQQEIIRLCHFATEFVDAEKRLLSGSAGSELAMLLNPRGFLKKQKATRLLRDQLVKTESELRWRRLRKASHVLTSSDADLPDRFAAAFAARLDEIYLRQTIADEPGYSFEQFENPNLADELQESAKQAQQAAGDLWDKSYALYVGLEWWRRGRFGRGPYGGGMLKGFAALKSLDQQIALSMPATFPEVTSSKAQSSFRMGEYPLSRRHKYLWQFEPPKGVSYKVRKWIG